MRLPLFHMSVLVSFALIASAQTPDQPLDEQTGAIHGVVVTVNDKKPVPQALAALASSDRSVTTNEKGEFTFTGVPFGAKVVSVKKAGFLCSTRLGPRPQCVKSVDVYTPVTQVELTLLREAIVTGRVVDQENAPIRNLALYLLDQQITEDGHYTWRGVGATHVRTDADGGFRMAKIEAGSYLLLVPTAFDPPGDFPPPNADHGYSATYYPGVVNERDAKPLVIHAGDEITANLTVRRENVQPITLNLLSDLDVEPGSIGSSQSDSTGSVLLAGGPIEHTRSFRFLAPPGDYKADLALNTPTNPQTGDPRPWPDGTSTPYYGLAKFTVRDRPITIENIPMQQPVNLSLHVHAQLTRPEKQQDASPLSQPSAFFRLMGGNYEINNQFEWRLNQSASGFEFKDVPPGQYTIRASGESRDYVASLACGSINLLREPLVIGPGIPSCSIEAVIRDDLASVSIGLTPLAKAQMAAYGTELTDFALVPVDNPLTLPLSGFIFRISETKKVQIPPGSYIAFLFDGSTPAWGEPKFQEQIKRLGTPVTLAPGDDKTLLLEFKPELDSPRIQPIGVASLAL